MRHLLGVRRWRADEILPAAGGKAQGTTIETVEALATTGELSVCKSFPQAGDSRCRILHSRHGDGRHRGESARDRLPIGRKSRSGSVEITADARAIRKIRRGQLARDVQNGTAGDRVDGTETDDAVIGKAVRRIDAPSKVSGRLRYAADMTMPGMLHVQVRARRTPTRGLCRSTRLRPRRWTASKISSPAPTFPGVDGFGVFVNDEPIMARDRSVMSARRWLSSRRKIR